MVSSYSSFFTRQMKVMLVLLGVCLTDVGDTFIFIVMFLINKSLVSESPKIYRSCKHKIP